MALFTVFLVVLIDLLGFGIVLPLLPYYGKEFHASGLTIGLLYSVYSMCQLVFSPFWGALSDRIGRRPVMLISTFGSCASYVVFAFSHSLHWLFLSRILAGIMGGNISTAQAYIADITTPQNRVKGMGMIGAAFGIGFAMGPVLAWALLDPYWTGLTRAHAPAFVADAIGMHPYVLPGLGAAMLSGLSFLLVLTRLKETVGKTTGSVDAGARRPSVFSGDFWSFLSKARQGKHHLLPLILGCVLLVAIGHSSLYSSFPLFCNQVLGLSAQATGKQFAVMGIVAILIQGGLMRRISGRIAEEKLLLAGSVLMTLGIAGIPFARSEHGLMAILSVMSVGASLNGPSLTSLASKEADPDNIGATLGIAQGISGLGRVIGPAWGGLLFGMAYAAPFWATAALVSLTILAAFKMRAQQA